jgi:hypothetical protein
MRPTGVLIAVPAYEHKMYAETALSIFCAAQFLAEKKIHAKMTWYSGADIEDVRNLFVTAWYDTQPEFSHLLFVDADMGFEPELIRDFIRFDKPLMGVLYAKRKAGPEIVGIVPAGHSIDDVVHGFIRADAVGCGVTMISREVITKMLEVMPYLSDAMPSSLMQATPDMKLKRVIRCFDKIRNETMRLSEDMSFCYRWQACGGEVWANVNHKISHVGPFDFAIRYGGVLAAKAAAQRQDVAA